MPHYRLSVHPAPFKPSHLSIPHSPFLPLSPLTPALPPQTQPPIPSLTTSTGSTQPAPTTPLQWVWTCHACHNAYPLGATRRCLNDGHHFCAGTTVIKKWRKDNLSRRTKKHKACKSEFDYLGWKAWGRWKRPSTNPSKASASEKHNPSSQADTGERTRKNCWTECDYPSQCRWGKTVGIHTPTPTQTTFFSLDTSAIQSETLHTPTDLPTLDACFVTSPPPFFEAERSVSALGHALIASAKRAKRAKRRKSLGCVSPTSPLETAFSQTSGVFDVEMVGVEHTRAMSSTCSMRDEGCIDPALLALADVGSSCTAAFPAGAASVGLENGGRSRTVHELISLSSPGPSRQHVELLPVSNAQRRLRRRPVFSALVIQKPLFRTGEPRIEGCSPLEDVRRWNESALNVV